jgi:hypothetical protein
MAVSYYQVFITPLETNSTYGDPIEVSDYVIAKSFNKIKQSIDAGSYDIGIYTYSDLALTFANYDGRFNDETDSASMFPFTRDRAKVQVKYIDESAGTNIVYEGLINDEATLQDFEKDTVKVRVLSLDSIFRKVKVAGGLINNSSSFSTAIKAVLNRPSITAVLGYDAGKVSVGYDGTIDDSTPFSQKDSRTVLELLLNASGSVFYIDSSGDMVVQDRSVLVKSALELFGAGDPYQRDNITKINNYNNGLQRTFNTVTVNDNTSTDDTYVDRYGIGLKTYTFDFVTSSVTATAIADYYVGQFKTPKAELVVHVKTEIAKSVGILDPVTIDYRKRHKAYPGSKVPIANSTVAGVDKSPFIIGGVKITPNKTWKVIGIEHNTKTFTTALRLREA